MRDYAQSNTTKVICKVHAANAMHDNIESTRCMTDQNLKFQLVRFATVCGDDEKFGVVFGKAFWEPTCQEVLQFEHWVTSATVSTGTLWWRQATNTGYFKETHDAWKNNRRNFPMVSELRTNRYKTRWIKRAEKHTHPRTQMSETVQGLFVPTQNGDNEYQPPEVMRHSSLQER